MKKITHLYVALVTMAAFLTFAHQASAQATLPYYWDPTGSTTSSGASYGDGPGTWDNTTFNWDLGVNASGTTTFPAGSAVTGTTPATTVSSITGTAAGTTLTLNSTAGLAIGENVFGDGAPANDYITAISGNTVTLSAAPTATTTAKPFTFGYQANFGNNGNGGTVNLSTAQTAYSVGITSPEYVFTGAQLTTSTITANAAGGTVEFDNNISNGVGTGGALGVASASGTTVLFSGGTLYGDTGFNFNRASGAAYTGTINFNNETLVSPGGQFLDIGNGTSNFTGTTAYQPSGGNARLQIGDAGSTTINIGSSTNSTAVLNLGILSGTTLTNSALVNVGASGNFSSTLNVYGTLNSGSLDVDNQTNATNTANIYAGSTANIGDLIVGTSSSTNLTNTTTDAAIANITGGTTTLGGNNYIYIGESNNVNNSSATLNISGGTVVDYNGIEFGSTNSTGTATNSAALNLSGGTLEIGAQGIKTASPTAGYNSTIGTYSATNTATNTQINLSGGTIQSLANFTDNLNMVLTKGTNGNVVFNTTSGTNNYTITLGGALSGTGGLTVAGKGTVILNAGAGTIPNTATTTIANTNVNTYSGTTEVQTGTLELNTNFALALPSSLVLDSLTGSDVEFNFATVGSIDTISSLTIAGTQVAAGIYTATALNQDYGTSDFSYGTGGASDEIMIVPEPKTWGMLFLGLGALVVMARRRRLSNNLL